VDPDDEPPPDSVAVQRDRVRVEAPLTWHFGWIALGLILVLRNAVALAMLMSESAREWCEEQAAAFLLGGQRRGYSLEYPPRRHKGHFY